MVDNIEVNTQNSIRIASRVGVIYVDPLEISDDRHDADYILITHDHYDHFSPEDIRKVAKAVPSKGCRVGRVHSENRWKAYLYRRRY